MIHVTGQGAGRSQGSDPFCDFIMKSVYRKLGQGPQQSIFVLEQQEAIPGCGSGEVLVQVKACGLSHGFGQVEREAVPPNSRLQLPGGTEVAGIVSDVGTGVTSLKKGDRVTGLLSVDTACSGLAEYCRFPEYDLSLIPDMVSFIDAAAGIGDGVKAYTALHYLAHMTAGDTVLVTCGATRWGWLTVQLAQHWGAKVLTSVTSAEEKMKLEKLQVPLAQVVEVNSTPGHLLSSVMEETGGVGADVVVDATEHLGSLADGGPAFETWTSWKHELISCLGIGGKWVTSKPDMQLDPPDCQQLFLRGSSVAFLFPYSWMLATTQHGRYQHILKDLLQKLATGVLKPEVTVVASLEDAVDILNNWPPPGLGTPVLKL